MIIIEKSIVLRAIRYFLRKISEFFQKIEFRYKYVCENSSAIDSLNTLYEQKPDRIFVIGNGPSLNEQNLDLLKGEFTICSNAFYLNYPNIDWRPTIITIEDPLPALDNASFFNSDKASLKLIPYDLRRLIKNGSSTIYINFLRSYIHSSRKKWPYFSSNFREKCFWGGTVSYLSLQIAASFSPKEIYLIGTDLSYKIPATAKIEGTIITSNDSDPNHFHGDYFGKGKKWHIPETWRMQIAFERAYNELDNLGICLFNATHGGNLKVIPRVNFQDLFK